MQVIQRAKPLFILSFAVFVSVILSSCSFRGASKPAILVIMVENLGFGAFSCQDTSTATEDAGFDAFCQEAVRFTHAYSPSTLTQPNVASILTGLYPTEHLVRHNGAQAISAKLKTVAEAARAQKYKTSFFSGGPPVWRRAGFAQGFDLFDDNLSVSLRTPYRRATSVVDSFLNWQANRVSSDSFLTFLSLSDPQFISQPTDDQFGVMREVSYTGQVSEVSEALDKLVREMKKRKIWNSTHVFLIGFGYQPESIDIPRDPQVIDLLSSSTHATLMIKPARKTRDPFTWKIDTNVSLADVGATLYDLLGAKQLTPRSGFQTASLVSSLSEPVASWSGDRLIVSESAWPLWRGFGTIRSAGRRGPYLYLFDRNDRLYNTLSDTLETSPLPMNEVGNRALRDTFVLSMEERGFVPWEPLPNGVIDKLEIGSELWRNDVQSQEMVDRLKALSRRFPADAGLRGWRAIVALERGDWIELKDASAKEKRIWTHIASLNLKEKSPFTDFGSRGEEKCFAGIINGTNEVENDCNDELARAALNWMKEDPDADARKRNEDDFFRRYLSQALLEKVAKLNAVAGDRFDLAAFPLNEPTIVDLMLSWPGREKYRNAVRRRVASESRGRVTE